MQIVKLLSFERKRAKKLQIHLEVRLWELVREIMRKKFVKYWHIDIHYVRVYIWEACGVCVRLRSFTICGLLHSGSISIWTLVTESN